MRIVGIDEAGYAPLLGPLVVSRVEFDATNIRPVSDTLLTSPYKIADSKTLFNGRDRMRRLEAPVLTFCSPNRTLGDYLQTVAPNDEPPFYSDPSLRLPVSAVEQEHRFRSDADVEFCGATSLFLSERNFNEKLKRFGNKAELLFEVVSTHIKDVLDRTDDDVLFIIDRLGSRRFYAKHLWDVFGASPNALKETKLSSEYLFREKGRRVLVRFLTDADAKEPVVSLASIFSKYLRELFMICFCAFFSRCLDEEVRVSGYYDGRTKRFIETAKKSLHLWGIKEEEFIRMA